MSASHLATAPAETAELPAEWSLPETQRSTSALLGIDLGTSSVKVVVVSTSGKILGLGSVEYPILTPEPGWAEQDPEEWWKATTQAVRQAIDRADRPKILAIGFSGQMHGPVLLDKAQKPLGNAIIWADQRAASVLPEIEERVERRVLATVCGTAPAAGFLISTLFWLKRFDEQRFDQIGSILLPKDYLRFRLCGDLATDPSDAAATGLFDVANLAWSQAVLEKLEFPIAIFPQLRDSVELAGKLSSRAGDALGLPAGIPVAVGSADQPAQAVGNGLFEPGRGSVTVGTGGQVFVPMAAPLVDPEARLHTFCHADRRRWYLLGAMLAAGMALRWLRQTLYGETVSYAEMDRRAEKIAPGCEGLFFLPYLVGERSPIMDPRARGSFVGLTLRHQGPHLVRALLEGVAFSLRQIVEAMEETGASVDDWIVSGNGLASPLWRQILADILQRPLLRGSDENSAERAGVGAAIQAGIAARVLKGFDEAKRFAPIFDQVTEPNQERAKRYEEAFARYQEIYPALREWFKAADGKTPGVG
jgi:xylulokinase